MQRICVYSLASGVVTNVVMAAGLADVPLADGEAVFAHDSAGVAWAYTKGVARPPPEQPANVADLKKEAANRRRALIENGCTVSIGSTAIPTWTDSQSQGALTSLVVAAQLNPNITTGWKGSDGDFYALDAAGIKALALGVMAFVQACFSKEQSTLAGIAAGTITTIAAVDAVFA